MSNCNICGRKTQVVQRKIINTGKQKGWTEVVHRCEIHGSFKLKIRPPRKGKL